MRPCKCEKYSKGIPHCTINWKEIEAMTNKEFNAFIKKVPCRGNYLVYQFMIKGDNAI